MVVSSTRDCFSVALLDAGSFEAGFRPQSSLPYVNAENLQFKKKLDQISHLLLGIIPLMSDCFDCR